MGKKQQERICQMSNIEDLIKQHCPNGVEYDVI